MPPQKLEQLTPEDRQAFVCILL